jgi:hypothetical protein
MAIIEPGSMWKLTSMKWGYSNYVLTTTVSDYLSFT